MRSNKTATLYMSPRHPPSVWAPGQSVPVPGGVRAPMGALITSPGVVSVWFNRQDPTYDTLWVAQFTLGPAPPFNPPDHTPLTLRPCIAGLPEQAFESGGDGTLRLASAHGVCLDLNACDTSVGMMDVWTCHVPGDMCGGNFPSNPPINQLFSVNSNGTISYTDTPAFCLASSASSHSWVAASVVLRQCSSDASQLWSIIPGGNDTFSIQQAGGFCINVG
jgi:hypothetical protein